MYGSGVAGYRVTVRVSYVMIIRLTDGACLAYVHKHDSIAEHDDRSVHTSQAMGCVPFQELGVELYRYIGFEIRDVLSRRSLGPFPFRHENRDQAKSHEMKTAGGREPSPRGPGDHHVPQIEAAPSLETSRARVLPRDIGGSRGPQLSPLHLGRMSLSVPSDMLVPVPTWRKRRIGTYLHA